MREAVAAWPRKLTCLFAPLLAASAIAGCATSDLPQTGVDLTLTYGLTLDAFVVTVWNEGREEVARVVVPEPGSDRRLSLEGETVAVAVTSTLAGESVLVRVDGLSWGDILATAEQEVSLVRNELVALSMHLGPSPGCGDGNRVDGEACDDGNAVSGDGCSTRCDVEPGWECQTPAAGGPSDCRQLCGESLCGPSQRCVDEACVCDGTSCPLGCCEGTTCREPTASTCGSHGESCFSCALSDSDGCVGGTCSCGTATICGGGLACLDGGCECDLLSCLDGCCDGEGGCVAPSHEACGVAGSSCVQCPAERSDACSREGRCTCGDEPVCDEGQRCQGGACLCDAESCGAGCCDLRRCIAPSTGSCGGSGGACTSCDAMGADSCGEAGECNCGSGAACAEGQQCEDGSCICGAASCDGCCDGTDCRAGTATAACGRAGAACEDCGASTSCTAGVCPSCDGSSCAAGCCSGGTCTTPSPAACGTSGAPCVACASIRADTCHASGECRCGTIAPCPSGQHCVEGSCRCDSTSCADGCCDAGACVTSLSPGQCGTGGASCGTCDATRADGCLPSLGCSCGPGSACEEGQRCVEGSCRCDSTSCADGCCDGATCLSPPTLSQCGNGGAPCGACNASRADGCSSGSCSCGSAAACVDGRACESGSCVD